MQSVEGAGLHIWLNRARVNFAEMPLEAILQNNAPVAWLESGAGLQAAEAPQCWACFPNQETLNLHKALSQIPFPCF